MTIQAYSCNENTTLTVKWWDNPPYWMNMGKDEDKGALYSMLQHMICHCCKNASLHYLPSKPREDYRDEYVDYEADILVPVARDAQSSACSAYQDEDDGSYFISAVRSPGLYYLVDDEIGSSVIADVLKQTWPLVFVIMLSAAYAGLLIWALDTYWNPEHFPRGFLAGFSEGVWWAFVTMTTVGYGDKTPRSIPGRLFSFVWVLTGVVILALFTATVTTSLTSETSSFTLAGKKVGCIRDSISYRHALTRGAKVEEMDYLMDLAANLKNDSSFDGIILDSFEMLHISRYLDKEMIKATRFIAHETIYGITVKDADEKLAKCFQFVGRRHRNKIYRDMKNELNEPTKENIPQKIASKIIAPQWIFLGIAFGAFVVVFVILVFLDCTYFRRNTKSFPVGVKEMEQQIDMKENRNTKTGRLT